MSIKIHQLNIAKITNKGYKISLVKNIEAFPRKRKKESGSIG